MAKKDYYKVEKNIDKIIRGEYTNFLDPSISKKVLAKLKGYNYKIYYPYKDCEKTIIYSEKLPRIKVLEIISHEKLSHPKILGSLFSLNIDTEMFGDIIIYDEHYYIMVMDNIYNLIIQEFNMVGNIKIKLNEVSLDIIKEYKQKYKKIELIVPSTRIDVIVAKLIGTSRDLVKKKFNNDEIVLNYEICHKINYNLKNDDIFSIRKHGKYKFSGIFKNTKRDNYIVKIYKYIND